MTEQRKIEKFGVGNLYPDINPPEFSFFKKKCIDVAIGYDDGFTFTPKFGDFKAVSYTHLTLPTILLV